MIGMDLKGNPFFLDDEQIQWVDSTKNGMSTVEKIGQLFFLLGSTTEEKELKSLLQNIKPGGFMFRSTSIKRLSSAYKVLQKNSLIPLLLAANLETGGNGLVAEGTRFGSQMLCAATGNVENAYRMGLICGREGAAAGANMTFAPVVDINYNFRNPIVNVRSFGDNPETVAEMGAAYIKGAHEAGLCVTVKHFPGDGTDGRDQHLVTTYNLLGVNDWLDTFGKVYKACIEEGARGLMAGHIGFPAYFDETAADHPDLRLIPASLNPVLLNRLLRKELGYNGLILSDSSRMTGFDAAGKRRDLVPGAIAAGCDMFLFTRQPEEDFGYMMEGYRNGVITDERLDDALTRILALKASLKLNNRSREALDPDKFWSLNLAEHRVWAKEAADQGITLVKDDLSILPLDPSKHRRIGVMYNGNRVPNDLLNKNIPGIKGFFSKILMALSLSRKESPQPYKELINRLHTRGFEAFYYSFEDILSVRAEMNKPLDKWKEQFDVIIFLAKWDVVSNQTSLRVQFKALGFDAPWFTAEVPTILVSLANPYHGYDLPMVKTVINAYSSAPEVYDAVVEKLTGESSFKGVSPVKFDFREPEIIISREQAGSE